MTKRVFVFLFALLAVSLLVLPVITTFDHFLTRVLNSFGGIRIVQEVIVPHEAKIIAVILNPFGFRVAPTPTGIYVNDVLVTIWWSCIGWQSLVILFVSLKGGLVSGVTKSSRLEALTFALVGTFLMNLARISAILIILYYFGKQPAAFFHNYVSIVITLLWLLFFWWFSYMFVLET